MAIFPNLIIRNVNEGSSRLIEFNLNDPDGNILDESDITAAFLTLIDLERYNETTSPSQGIINNRVDQDVLNDNDVTIANPATASDRLISWASQPEDNIINNRRRAVERHQAIFTFETTAGQLKYCVEINVNNLRGV